MNIRKANVRSLLFPPDSVISPTLNLYRSTREFTSYMRWLLTRDHHLSSQNLKSQVNKYRGEKAVILCNGPSLLKSNLELLDSTFTIGLNKINLLFERSSFRPSVIVAVNRYVIEQNSQFFKVTDIPVYLSQKPARKVGIHADGTRTLLFSSGGRPGFSTDIRHAVHEGATVTYVALQLAYFLGFKKVALIGCDHNFNAKGPDHQLVKSGEVDSNHFDPRYFAGGVLWQLPSITESEESYLRAKRFYDYDQRSIYNCTVGGKLELYPRISLEQFLKS